MSLSVNHTRVEIQARNSWGKLVFNLRSFSRNQIYVFQSRSRILIFVSRRANKVAKWKIGFYGGQNIALPQSCKKAAGMRVSPVRKHM